MADKSITLLKGTLDVLILKTLSWGPMHGYAVSRSIRQVTDEAFRVEEGALYPALRRLEKKGWLEASWGMTETRREAKFYALTREGRRQLQVEVNAWTRYVETMSRVLYRNQPLEA
ncbi:MAG: PadR family transcriptional regulator [Acidobacteriota bacterium]